MGNLIEQLKEAARKASDEFCVLPVHKNDILALISEIERLRNCIGLTPQCLTDFECSVNKSHLLKRVGAEKA